MKRGAVAIVSVLTALLFVQPASGQPGSVVTFEDKPDDLGHPVYTEVDGLAEPARYWPATTPVYQAGYLDLLGGSLSIDDGVITGELVLAEEWATGSILPDGVKAVWWTWFFGKDTSTFWADYAIHVCWDGSAVVGILLVRGDDPVRPLESFEVSGNTVRVEFQCAFVEEAVGWFAESICWNYHTPETDDQGYMPSGGWFAADITDGPIGPWLPMPE
jgi:hypothetical protein